MCVTLRIWHMKWWGGVLNSWKMRNFREKRINICVSALEETVNTQFGNLVTTLPSKKQQSSNSCLSTAETWLKITTKLFHSWARKQTHLEFPLQTSKRKRWLKALPPRKGRTPAQCKPLKLPALSPSGDLCTEIPPASLFSITSQGFLMVNVWYNMIFFLRDHMEEHTTFYVRDAGLKKGSIASLAWHWNVTHYGEVKDWESRRFEKSYHKQKPAFTLYFISLINETFLLFYEIFTFIHNWY